MNPIPTLIITLGVTLSILGIVAGITYSDSLSKKLANNCIEHGGTWLNYSSMCVGSNVKN